MKKIDRFWYQVNPQELVTIQVTPSVDLGSLYTASLDGHSVDKPADGKYVFLTTRPVGKKHFFIIELSFAGAPEGSQYTLDINGDTANNSGPFRVTVKRADALLHKTFIFEVVQDSV